MQQDRFAISQACLNVFFHNRTSLQKKMEERDWRIRRKKYSNIREEEKSFHPMNFVGKLDLQGLGDIELSFCHFPHHYHHKRAEKSLVSNQCPIVSHSTHCCQWSECPLNLSLSFPSSASLLDIVNTQIIIVFADTHNICQHQIYVKDYSCCDWHIDNQKWFAAQIFVNIGEYNTPVTKLLIVNLSSTNQM